MVSYPQKLSPHKFTKLRYDFLTFEEITLPNSIAQAGGDFICFPLLFFRLEVFVINHY